MARRLLWALLFAAGGAGAAQVQVAVAANMAAPMRKIAADFARASGHEAVARLDAAAVVVALRD